MFEMTTFFGAYLALDTSVFGTRHIIVLCLTLVLMAAALFFMIKYRIPMKKLNRIMLLMGIASETVKVVFYVLANEDKSRGNGYLPKTDLPFHLCSIQIILLLILNLATNEKVKRVIYSFMLPTCLIGGFAAMLLPTSSARTAIAITIQYFIYHGAIVLYAIYLYCSKEINFEINDYFNALKCLVATFFVAIYLNSWVNDYQNDINFMYVVNPPVSGLPFLNRDHGWLVYIVHYALLCVLCVTLVYIKPVIKGIKDKTGRKNDRSKEVQ